jgi:hypothetical protein
MRSAVRFRQAPFTFHFLLLYARDTGVSPTRTIYLCSHLPDGKSEKKDDVSETSSQEAIIQAAARGDRWPRDRDGD